ncbi:hypothetical protein [Mycobacteroides franklinii]|uniref:ParB/Sulfiredoxin domain-containing protein n=1 Tax=Mycobacteroides franklinii TaxID=948102 RepID=A0A4R5P8I7_9MYCO|nr:hypothetical protein [Mycobacteroides franklinii]ORA58442.1 hypothetical protein BST24_21725 [Mycobacteroides franklinii]TDH20183.1 hypothetical protein EJ571_15420 [Mycobacteroides franklinii]
MAYKQLPMVEVDLDGLFLDLENYRIPTRRDDEAGALKYLFMSEDVLGAARLILRDGYFDNEVPIVIAVSDKDGGPPYIVLEGNRRVSALKALRDPSIVPGHESELRTLLKRYEVESNDLPERIRVLVAPDRAMAAPHIARLHTGLSKKRWSLDQQATFYYSLVDDLTTVEDVKAQYPDVTIPRFMKMAVTRRFLVAVPFADHSLRQYAASDDLAMSAFEYAYRSKDIASAIGMEFDTDGLLLPRSSTPAKIGADLPKSKLSALEYLVSEFRAGRLNTRSPEFKKRSDPYQRLVDRLNGVSGSPGNPESSQPSAPTPPFPSPSTSPTPTTITGGNAPASSGGDNSPSQPATSGTRGPNHPDTKDTLDLSGLEYESAPLNLKLRYFELRKVSLSNLPISASILLRSVLESTIKVHFESSATPVSGELSAVFRQIDQSYGQIKALRATISAIQSGNAHKHGSIQWFNLTAHSADASVTAEDVRQAWKVVSPLLRHLLRQSVQPSPEGE